MFSSLNIDHITTLLFIWKEKNLFFSNLFLSYAENKKGEVALEILLNKDLIDTLIIPSYIKEGIEWLMK